MQGGSESRGTPASLRLAPALIVLLCKTGGASGQWGWGGQERIRTGAPAGRATGTERTKAPNGNEDGIISKADTFGGNELKKGQINFRI